MSPSKKANSRPLAAAEDARQSLNRSDKAYHQALIKIHYGKKGEVVETPLETLGGYSPEFRKSVLLVEDKTSDSNRCSDVLREMGYHGVQVITSLSLALEYLDDVIDKLTYPPDAIILDLGLGYDSGFDVLRKCHAHSKLSRVPVLIWTKQANEQVEAFTSHLGAKDFLVKTRDLLPLRKALTRLLQTENQGAGLASARRRPSQ
jgi:PleD family two-component response regulator